MNVARRWLWAIPLVVASVVSAQDTVKAPRLAQGRHPSPRQQAFTPSLPPLSPETQLALDGLTQQYAMQVEQIPGWLRDHPVLYYNFGEVPQPVTPGRVLWPVHGFDAHGNPVAIRGQRP